MTTPAEQPDQRKQLTSEEQDDLDAYEALSTREKAAKGFAYVARSSSGAISGRC
jgi:hypothetical protein